MSSGRNQESPLKAILVAVVIALLVGGSSPWWWKYLFGNPEGPSSPLPSPSIRCPERTVNVDQIPVSTNSSNSSVEEGDDEIHSDDWTSVKVSYHINKINDDCELELVINWHAQERNKDKSKGDTKITSFKRIPLLHIDPLCPSSKIIEINGLVLKAEKEKYYKDERHSFNSFPNFGSLTNIQVQFDGKGPGDDQRQALEAVLKGFSVKRSEMQ
jgi:hypothetical protein